MFAKKSTAAIDLGAHSLKYVEVETDSGLVRKAWQAPLQPDRVDAQDALHGADLCKRVAALVRRLQAEASPPTRVVTALQGEGTWVQYLEFPLLSESELKMAAQAVACKIIPFPLARVVLSTVSVPPLHEGRSGVLVVAALKEPAGEMSSLFDACGLIVHRMEVVPLALAREFNRNHPDRAGRFVALVNVGFSLTHVVVLREGLPYYVREFPIGGRHFMHGLQRADRLTWVETERRFHSAHVNELGAACDPAMREWLHEVSRTVTHFNEKVAGPLMGVEEVWLSGGCSAWQGLRDAVAAHLELPVEVDGWNRIRWGAQAPQDEAGPWKAAVGMALEQ